MIETSHDKYGGVIIDSATLSLARDEFEKEIKSLVATLKDKKLVWVKIPIEKSDFIPTLTKLGFEFHHCDEKSLMLLKKMANDSYVPTTKNFIVGVGAIVLHQGQLLVIRDRFSPGYKLPGGHVDKNETIKSAVKREVYEETGVHVEFESIVNLGHFRNGQFGESNLYIVCTAKALSEKITVNDISEIAEARWISPDDFFYSGEVNNYNKSVVKAVLNNKELKLMDQAVELRVPGGEVFF
jgi:8-oxo-dGTP diphosphatase